MGKMSRTAKGQKGHKGKRAKRAKRAKAQTNIFPRLVESINNFHVNHHYHSITSWKIATDVIHPSDLPDLLLLVVVADH